MGYCFYRLGDAVAACFRYEEALAAKFTNAEVFNDYAAALLAEGQFNDAERFAQKALDADPNLQAAHFNHAYAILRLAQESAQSGRPMAYDPALAAAEMRNLLAQRRGTVTDCQMAATLCAVTLEFRDGAHGLLVWALGVVLSIALLWATTAAYTAANNAAQPPRESAGAPSFLAYELDRLFRSDRRTEPAPAEVRAEASRLIMKGIGRQDMAPDDRTHLNRMVAGSTGLAAPEAERRVGQVLTEARNSAAQARRSAVIIGFATAAALAAAAAAAWFAAGEGGKHRDGEFAPPLRFGRPTTTRVYS